MNGKEVHPTICARFTGAPTLVELPGSYGRSFGSKGKLQDTENVSDTLLASMGTGGGNIPIILDDNEAKINVIGNYSPSGHEASRIIDPNGIAPTFKDNHGTITAIIENNEQKFSIYKSSDYRIRKLTPKECFRLMGFKDEEFEKAKKVNSNSQLYKQARKFDSC